MRKRRRSIWNKKFFGSSCWKLSKANKISFVLRVEGELMQKINKITNKWVYKHFLVVFRWNSYICLYAFSHCSFHCNWRCCFCFFAGAALSLCLPLTCYPNNLIIQHMYLCAFIIFHINVKLINFPLSERWKSCMVLSVFYRLPIKNQFRNKRHSRKRRIKYCIIAAQEINYYIRIRPKRALKGEKYLIIFPC